MKKYIIRRILQSIPVLIGISIIVFSLIKLAPGDPILSMVSGIQDITQGDIDALRAAHGFDQPIYVQYFKYMKGVVRGDLGWSMKFGLPVTHLIKERMWSTFYLAFLSMLLALVIAIPIGVVSATKQYSKFDYFFTVFALVGISIPSFFFAMTLMKIFAVDLKWLPVSGMQTPGANFAFPMNLIDILRHSILPSVVLGLGSIGGFMRYTRGSMLEVIRQDYIRTARAKGLKEKVVIYKHALRNGLIPIITLLGLQLPALFSGALIVEQIYSWPGMGRMSFSATTNRDYPLMMGLNLFLATLTLVGNLCADIAYAVVDPRIRFD